MRNSEPALKVAEAVLIVLSLALVLIPGTRTDTMRHVFELAFPLVGLWLLWARGYLHKAAKEVFTGALSKPETRMTRNPVDLAAVSLSLIVSLVLSFS